MGFGVEGLGLWVSGLRVEDKRRRIKGFTSTKLQEYDNYLQAVQATIAAEMYRVASAEDRGRQTASSISIG